MLSGFGDNYLVPTALLDSMSANNLDKVFCMVNSNGESFRPDQCCAPFACAVAYPLHITCLVDIPM